MTGAELLRHLHRMTDDELSRPLMVRVGSDDYQEVYIVVAVPHSIDLHLRTPSSSAHIAIAPDDPAHSMPGHVCQSCT